MDVVYADEGVTGHGLGNGSWPSEQLGELVFRVEVTSEEEG